MKNTILFALMLALATLACSSNAANSNVNITNTTNTNSNTSPTAKPNAAKNETAKPETTVADLYKQHDAKKSPFYQTKDRASVDKYFTKTTADLIWKDAKDSEKSGDAGALGADPLYDAQDTDIKNFKVGQAEIKDKSAIVPVRFENFGKKQTVTYALVKENDAWKIEDIKYAESGSLVKNLKGNYSNETISSEGNFEGKYQIGDTTCAVKPVKMAFEVKWEKGAGLEMFFSEGEANDKFIFASRPETGKSNVFSFDDENYNSGIFYRADGKELPIKRIK